MKRILARILALATVLALGSIAIVQAQRSMGDSESEASPDAGLGSGTGQETDSSGPQQDFGEPGLNGSGAPAAPRLFPGGPHVNPLRTAERPGYASHVVPTSAESLSERFPDDSSTESTTPRESSIAYSQDVFAATGADGIGDTTDRVTPQPDPLGEPPPEAIPFDEDSTLNAGTSIGADSRLNAASPTDAGSPANLGLDGFPPGSSPLRGGSVDAYRPAVDGPANRNPVRPPASDRYGGPVISAPDSGTPNTFELDTSNPSTRIPYNAIGSDDRYTSGGSRIASQGMGGTPEGTGTPGNKQLEGPQMPQLTVQKSAPPEIQVGKAATFRVKVSNTGQVAAHGVEIRDEIPKGTRLIATNPPSSQGPQGELVWSIGALGPGEEVSVEVELMPIEEGEIGSVATVHMNADASVRTVATKPELVLHTSAPKQVLIGDEMTLTITVSNPGTGVTTGVVVEEHVPAGLQHPAGKQLEYAVGDLKPNESRQLELTLTADRPGQASNVLIARADANLSTEDRLDIEVIAPELEVTLEGPRRRYLEREATYTLSVANPGTAAARNVELVAYLPEGFQFLSANNAGQYEPASRAVHWNLEELPVQEIGTVTLTAIPVQAGEHRLRFAGTGERGLATEGEQLVRVEGIAAILFQVVDVDDPIELGGETTYEIRVVNQGSKAATNVQVVALLPREMRAVAAEGPVRHSIQGDRIVFEGLPRLAPRADTTYRVRVQGLHPGDLRLRVQLLTEEMDDWVTKEESTRVYSDE